MLRSQTERQLNHNEVDAAFRADVLKGLSVKPRAIPARWLYDRRGSALFDAITALPEYYPTRTERSILSSAIKEIAALTGPGRAIVEFGSGSSAKTPILLLRGGSRSLCADRYFGGLLEGIRSGTVAPIPRIAGISGES